MATTRKLQDELKTLLGSNNVYFQPPKNLQIKYPCIIFSRGAASQEFADNKTYRLTKRYVVTHIGYDADPDIIEKMAEHFSMCSYTEHYVKDNLQHDIFSLYW